MSENDPFNSYEDLEDDIGLEEEGKEEFKRDSDNWFKMDKGQIVRAAMVFFHSVDANAVVRARKANKNLSADEVRAIAQKALEARATALSKTIDALTAIDRLDTGEIKMKRFDFHYQQGLGYVLSRMGKDGPEGDKVWSKLDPPKRGYSSVLLLYPMKGNTGEVHKEKIGEFEVVPWRFSKPVYERVWKLNAGLRENNITLATQDLKLECKDKQYQNIDVSFAGPAIWQRSEKFRAAVLERAMAWYPKLVPFREMTTDQLRAKLGFGGPAVSDVSAGGDFTELLDNV
jgi:hypothetical protein